VGHGNLGGGRLIIIPLLAIFPNLSTPSPDYISFCTILLMLEHGWREKKGAGEITGTFEGKNEHKSSKRTSGA
jgi:hypothetical protein